MGEADSMNAFVGIDLGTTFSAAATIGDDGRPYVIPNAEGDRITPSVIWFGSEPPIVGRLAKEEQKAGATAIAAFFKRAMGDPNYRLSFHDREYDPVALSTLVLRKIKADCEAALRQPVGDAVITVPAYFDNRQREATIEAGCRAGLNVLRIINEPTAAALAYGVQNSGQNESCLVYDLGGGTFDVTVVRITAQSIEVLATDGDHELGGKDWDDRVAQFLATRFREEHGFDPLERTDAFQDLLVRCEQAKQDLSKRNSVNVSLDFEGVRGTYPLSREKFEELTVDLMERTQRLTERTLSDAGIVWRDLTSLLLVGGSTKMPMVSSYVERMSGKKPRVGVNVDEAVALGAAIQASLEMQARNKTRRALPGARRIQDVMSHSLGVVAESADRARYVNTKILEKNKPIPAADKRPYQLRTRARGENFWEVYVTQGESDDPTACAIIGKYRLSDITHVPGKQLAVLDIQYEYDANGVVAVSATERSTGKPLKVVKEPVPADMSWLCRPPATQPDLAHATIYLAFDLSGSMSGAPLAEAQKAARGFVEQIDLAHNSIGLISFADSCATNVKACQDARKINQAIKRLEIGSVGGGNDTDPFDHARRLLAPVDDPRYLIVLADGVWSHQSAAVAAAKKCRDLGIEIVSVGFGGADQRFLDEIASASLGSFWTSLSSLVETFSSIAQAITEGHVGPASQLARRK